MQQEKIQKARIRRNWRARRKIFGTPDRPRLTVFRSGRHLYAQIIDDYAGLTLASAGTQTKGVRETLKKTGNIAAAEAVGTAVAKRAIEVGIKAVCFDRNGYRFHGRVKALAGSRG